MNEAEENREKYIWISGSHVFEYKWAPLPPVSASLYFLLSAGTRRSMRSGWFSTIYK